MKNDLIIVEQLPIIKARLENLSIEIKEKVARATSLVVNDETVKEVKQVRADLNKEFAELETQRKQVKQAIMAKYNEFEKIYKKNVSNLYKNADAELKEKIDNVENQLKQEKEEELREFVKQHCEANKIHIEFEKIGLNITLSASMKSLKEQALKFIEGIVNDLKLIELEEFKSEILLEYNNNGFDFSKAKLDVITRRKQLEEIQRQQEEKQVAEQKTQEVIETVEKILEPVEVIDDEDVITVTFTITDTKENIIKVREFMKKEGIKYE